MKIRSIWILVGIGVAGLGFMFRCPSLVSAIRIFRPNEAKSEPSGGKLLSGRPSRGLTGEQDLRELNALTDLLRRGQYQDLCDKLRVVGIHNPIGWLDWVGTCPEAQREAARFAVLTSWYQARPAEMLAWAEANESSFFSSTQFSEAAVELGNHAFALSGLKLISNEPAQLTRIETVFAGFAARDITQALSAADALEPVRRQAALLGILRVLAVEAPALALDVADTYSDSSAHRFGLLKVAVESWISQKGTDSARDFLLGKAISENLDGGYAALASSLAVENPAEASGWLGKIANSALREEATVAVINQLTASHPDIASKLVADLINTTPGCTNEGLTLARLEGTVQQWAEKDPPAAFSFVYSLNSLSSPGRKALLQRLAFY
jgi:hypothetical protein